VSNNSTTFKNLANMTHTQFTHLKTAKMQTLKFKTSVTTEQEVEIPVPFFCRTKDERQYWGLLDEKTLVNFYVTKDLVTIKNCNIQECSWEKADIVKAYLNHIGCSESEFVEAYDKAVASISLHPILAV